MIHVANARKHAERSRKQPLSLFKKSDRSRKFRTDSSCKNMLLDGEWSEFEYHREAFLESGGSLNYDNGIGIFANGYRRVLVLNKYNNTGNSGTHFDWTFRGKYAPTSCAR